VLRLVNSYKRKYALTFEYLRAELQMARVHTSLTTLLVCYTYRPYLPY
jgi:hypothetical protein